MAAIPISRHFHPSFVSSLIHIPRASRVCVQHSPQECNKNVVSPPPPPCVRICLLGSFVAGRCREQPMLAPCTLSKPQVFNSTVNFARFSTSPRIILLEAWLAFLLTSHEEERGLFPRNKDGWESSAASVDSWPPVKFLCEPRNIVSRYDEMR